MSQGKSITMKKGKEVQEIAAREGVRRRILEREGWRVVEGESKPKQTQSSAGPGKSGDGDTAGKREQS